MKKVFARLDDAEFHVKFNLVMLVVWGFLFFPSLLLWKESIVWLVFMSCYANFVGHLSGWMGAKAELETVKQNENGTSDNSD